MIKKYLLLIVVVITSLFIVGCGTEEAQEVAEEKEVQDEVKQEFIAYDLREIDREVEISLWRSDNLAVSDTMTALIEEFEAEKPMVSVEKTTVVADDLRRNVQAEFLAGGGPDIILTSFKEMQPFSRLRMATTIDDKISDEMSEMYIENGLEAMTLNDSLYGIPKTMGGHLMLLYNKEYINEAPEGWEDLIEASREFTSTSDERYGLVYDLNNPLYWIAFYGGLDGWIFDDDFNPTLDTEASRDALEFVQNLKLKHDIIPAEADREESEKLFVEGKAAFIIESESAIASYKDNPNIEVGVASLPVFKTTDKRAKPLTTGSGYMIMEDLARREEIAALKFIKFMTSTQAQQKLLMEENILPTNKEVYQTDEILQNENLKAVGEQLMYSRPEPIVDEYQVVLQVIENVLEDVMSGELNPVEAAKMMQQQVEKDI